MLDNALDMINEICNCGFKAYIVGGFVRDHLLGIKSKDIDITTNATPKDIRDIFKDDCLPGEDYGSVVVIKKNYRYEITTFRKDIGYVDNRRPSEIEYIDSLDEDLLRRDFTINTICMDKDGKIIDRLNGIDDLKKRVIRCVGDADTKFSEDALRILRAIRFATILNFKLDSDVIKSIEKNKELLKNLSFNRKKDELDKIFTSANSRNGINMILRFKLDKELEIKKLDKVRCFSSSISIWSVLECSDKYPFSSNEKDIIKNVNEVMKKNNLDPMNLFYYGLYVNSIAGEIKGINPKKITKAYVNLPIKRRRDIDVEADDIAKLLNKEPGGYLKDIFEDLENEILYRRLPNDNDKILSYIKNKYKNKEGVSMKRIRLIIILFLMVLLPFVNVNALNAVKNNVSPALNKGQGSVNTFDHYTYSSTQLYRQGEDLYFYSLIKNNDKKQASISVEVLLFDSNDKNIGIFNYCSARDYETDYASYKIQSNSSVEFNYKLVKKYLVSDKYKFSDVASYAIIDDNEYCKTGGYDRYKGKTLDQIVSKVNAKPSGTKFDAILSKIDKYIPIDGFNVGSAVFIVIAIVSLIISIIIWIAYGKFLNKLHDRMYSKVTPLAYVPIANNFLCVKMAFGQIIGFAYLGVTFLGALLTIVGFGFVIAIANLALIGAFVLDIVKLITGKYELCYLDNSSNNVIVNNFDGNNNMNMNNNFDNNMNMNNNNMNNNNMNNNFDNNMNNNMNMNNNNFNETMQNEPNEYGYSQENNVKESLLGMNVNNTLDDDSSNVSLGNNTNDNNMNNGFDNNQDNVQNNNNDNNNSDSDSDLSRFFR